MMIGTTTVDEKYLEQLERKAGELEDYLEATRRLWTRSLRVEIARREGSESSDYAKGYMDAVYGLGNLIDEVLTERLNGLR